MHREAIARMPVLLALFVMTQIITCAPEANKELQRQKMLRAWRERAAFDKSQTSAKDVRASFLPPPGVDHAESQHAELHGIYSVEHQYTINE